MDVVKYYEQLKSQGHSYEKCHLHYYTSWDELPLCDCSQEVKMGTCRCKFKSKKIKNPNKKPYKNFTRS